MKKRTGLPLATTLAAVIGLSSAGLANATITFGDGGASLQGVLDGITVAPNNNVSSTNVNTDQLSSDSYWKISGSGGSFAQLIVELTDNADNHIVGIYDAVDPTKMVTLFTGAEGPGAQKLLTFANDGSVIINFADTGVNFAGNAFGYFLDTGVDVFYSDQSLNADNIDHMVTFQGTGTDTIDLPSTLPGVWDSNEYILAWEDALGGGDADYNDFVLITESVNPIPEPSMLAMFGIGLLGLYGMPCRRNA